MVDLVPLAAVAKRLIKENGRSVTFIQHNATLSDPTKPWEGPTSARTTPASTSVLDAVFVEPASATKLGLALVADDLIVKSDQIMIVAPGAVNLSIFQEVLDEAVYWKITGIALLRPGVVTALAFVGVAR